MVAVHALAAAEVRKGCRVEVFTTDRNGDRRLELPTGRVAELDGVRVNYFKTKSLRPFAYSRDMMAALHRRVPDADIVHIHGLYTYPTWAGGHQARRVGKPYVLSPRGMLDPHAIQRRRRLAKLAYIMAVEGHNIRNASVVHFTTPEELDLARRVIRIRNSCVIENAVPFDASLVELNKGCTHKFWPELAGKRMVLFVGRIDPKKGLELALDAFAEVAGTDRSIHLVVAGEGDRRYVEGLKQQARSLGLATRASFVGFVQGQEKAALLADATVFVLPSYSENFGNSVVEAMAAGIPVVVSNRVNLAGRVQTAGAGIVADCSPASIAAALRKLLHDANALRKAGAAGRELASNYTDAAPIADEMVRIYDKVLSEQ